MRFLYLHVAIGGWLMFTAFALGHSEGAAALTVLLGVLIGTFGFAAAGMPVFRLLNAPLAIVLACVALFATESSVIGRVNNGLVAAVVLALASVPGRAWGTGPEPAP